MKYIWFSISHKENENRRAIVPEHVRNIALPELLFIERGYGDILGISDADYKNIGCKIAERDELLNCDILVDPKIGDAEYLNLLHKGQTIFGWIHATQNKDITDKIINHSLTAYAWEKMFYKGRHVFWCNNELAGEAAVMHAFQCYGKMPYETKVAVIGRGNTARGAIKILNMLGADVIQYDRKTEALLKEEIDKYDVIVNCVLWDIKRNDHLIYKSDLQKMKKNSIIIDVSCDRHGGIETSVPTTIENPIYSIDGIIHYVVDLTPSLFYKTFTYNNSEIIGTYLEELMTGNVGKVLKKALIIENGKIIDNEINVFQNRLNPY